MRRALSPGRAQSAPKPETPNLAQDARSTLAERRVDPGSLTGRHKSRKDKAERMESVMEGREVTFALEM